MYCGPITAVVITNKNKKRILRTTDSLAFADELIIVVDSKDGHPLDGDFAAQRNYALTLAKNDWVIFVDDDEVVSPALAAEVTRLVRNNKYSGYYLKRLDSYYGQIIHHGETGNIKLIRLAQKGSGKWQRPVHEIWRIKGRIGCLQNPLIHYRENLVSTFLDKISFYGPLDAQALIKEGKPFSLMRLILNPLGKFILNYKLKFGILDGHLGLFHAYLMSIQSLSVRVFQWQIKS